MNEEQALADRAAKGDRTAFAEIVVRNESAVFGYLRARLVQPTDAEDMTQEVFLRFFTSRARFDSSNMIRPWLLGIARNVLREHARRRRRQRECAWTEICLDVENTVAGDERTYDDVATHLPECLDSLGPSARDAIRLKYRGETRLRTIGEKLKRSEGAVKLLVHRARQALRNCLERKLRTEPGVH